MIQLNLLPDVKKEFIRAQKTRNMVTSLAILAILAALGLVVLIALYVYGFQNGQIFLYNQAIDQDQKELREVAEIDKYVTLQNQLNQLENLHDDKNVYSRFMEFFRTLNPQAPNQISLSAAEVNSESGTIQLTGSTRSFESFNIFKDTLDNAKVSYRLVGSDEATEEDLFTEVLVESAALGEINDQQRVAFSVSLTYNQAAFLFSSNNVAIKIPNIETTDSSQSAPNPLFNQDEQPTEVQ